MIYPSDHMRLRDKSRDLEAGFYRAEIARLDAIIEIITLVALTAETADLS